MSSKQGLMDFLAKHGSALPEEVVHVEQWGREVTLRGLSSRERDLFEEDNIRRANAKSSNGAGKLGGGRRGRSDKLPCSPRRSPYR